MTIVAAPSLDIDLTSGLSAGISTPFFLTGLTQYFLKMPSQSHRMRDWCSDVAKTALSAMD